VQTQADVLTGTLYIRASLSDVSFTAVFGTVVAPVLMEICPDSRAVAASYQAVDVEESTDQIYRIIVMFNILTKDVAECSASLHWSMQGGSFQSLVEMQVHSYKELDEAVSKAGSEWHADPRLPLPEPRNVTYPKFMEPLPEPISTGRLSSAQVAGTTPAQLFSDGTAQTDQCDLAASACLCSTMTGCVWGRNSTGGLQCVQQSKQNSLNSVLSGCDACPLQDGCIAVDDEGCGMYTSPCSCALSVGGCVWESGSCRSFTENLTVCTLCSRQIHCANDIPQVIAFQPEQGSQESFGTVNEINVTFDRNITALRSGLGQVALLCAGSDTVIQVPNDAIQFSESLVRIQADSVTNPKPRQCELLMTEGFAGDEAGVASQGVRVGSYSFFLADTQDPVLLSLSPAIDASVYPDAVVQITFDEDVFISDEFEAVLVRLAASGLQVDNEVIFRMLGNAPEIATKDASLTIGMSGYLAPGEKYSLYLKTGSVKDSEHNKWSDQMWVGYYVFSVVKQPTDSDAFDSFDMRPLIVTIAILSVLGAIICGVSLPYLRHIYGMRKELASRLSKRMSSARVSYFKEPEEDEEEGTRQAPKGLKRAWTWADRIRPDAERSIPESKYAQKKRMEKEGGRSKSKAAEEETAERSVFSDADTSEGSGPEDSVPENPETPTPGPPPGAPPDIDVPVPQHLS